MKLSFSNCRTYDGTRLPDLDTSVGIFDRRQSSVGVDFQVLWTLDICIWNGSFFPWYAEFIKNHSNLRRIGTHYSSIQDEGL